MLFDNYEKELDYSPNEEIWELNENGEFVLVSKEGEEE